MYIINGYIDRQMDRKEYIDKQMDRQIVIEIYKQINKQIEIQVSPPYPSTTNKDQPITFWI